MHLPTLNPNDASTWRVLVVDDEPDNLEVVAETLEFNGATTVTASNGLDGLDKLQKFAANLILLDLSMPKMDGWQMRGRVKANPATWDLPIIALTAHAMAGDEDRAYAAGFTGYLIKPVNIAKLVNDIRGILDAVKHTHNSERQ